MREKPADAAELWMLALPQLLMPWLKASALSDHDTGTKDTAFQVSQVQQSQFPAGMMADISWQLAS